MSKKKLSLNFLYKRLDLLEMNILFSTYHFFVVYNNLNIQQKDLDSKNTGLTKTRFFFKTVTKLFVFSSLFDYNTFKYPLFIQLIKTVDFFEFIVLNFFKYKRKNLQLKYNNSIFLLKDQKIDFSKKITFKLKEVHSFSTLSLDFFFVY